MANKLLLIVSLVACFLGNPGNGHAEDVDKNEMHHEKVLFRVESFIDVFFSSADKMESFYANKIVILRGSSLRNKDYGGLGKAGDDDKKNIVVNKVDLLAAYEKVIAKGTGEDNWKIKRVLLKKSGIKLITVDITNFKELAAIGAKKKDIVAILSPENDPLLFVFRKIGNKWLIVVDAWN